MTRDQVGAIDLSMRSLDGEVAPGLKWKALNVKKRLGVAVGDGEPTD